MKAKQATSAAADVVVRNPHGIHLRPAAQFARMALATGCNIKVEANGVEANGASIFALALLGALQGTTLRISADGADAEEAVRSLVALVTNGFSGT